MEIQALPFFLLVGDPILMNTRLAVDVDLSLYQGRRFFLRPLAETGERWTWTRPCRGATTGDRRAWRGWLRLGGCRRPGSLVHVQASSVQCTGGRGRGNAWNEYAWFQERGKS